jgi:hypothetical protein
MGINTSIIFAVGAVLASRSHTKVEAAAACKLSWPGWNGMKYLFTL